MSKTIQETQRFDFFGPSGGALLFKIAFQLVSTLISLENGLYADFTWKRRSTYLSLQCCAGFERLTQLSKKCLLISQILTKCDYHMLTIVIYQNSYILWQKLIMTLNPYVLIKGWISINYLHCFCMSYIPFFKYICPCFILRLSRLS